MLVSSFRIEYLFCHFSFLKVSIVVLSSSFPVCRFFPIFFESSIVSGRLLLHVSGKTRARTPATNANNPKVRNGNNSKTLPCKTMPKLIQSKKKKI